MPSFRYSTAKKNCLCAHCHRKIAQGTLHAYDTLKRKHYHLRCADGKPRYADRVHVVND